VTLSGPNSVIGRSMVIYEREDDVYQTEHDPSYGRDGRYREGQGLPIACCVIGWSKADEPYLLDYPAYSIPGVSPE